MKIKYIATLMLVMSQQAFSQDKNQCNALIENSVKLWEKEKYSTAITSLQKVRRVAENQGWFDVLFDANNNLGANYHSLLMYGDALSHYLESYTIALKHLQPKEEMIVLNNIAIIYSEEGNYQKAKSYFERALFIAKANKNHVKEGLYSINLAILAKESHDFSRAESLIRDAIPLIGNYPALTITAKLTAAEIAINKGNTAQARKELLPLLDNKALSKYQEVTLLHVVALSYLEDGDHKKFIYHAKQALGCHPDDETREEIFQLLSIAYYKWGDLHNAYAYKDSLLHLMENLEKRKNLKLLKGNEVKLNVQEYKNRILALDEQKKSQKSKSLLIGSLIIALATIVVLIYRNLTIKYKQKKILTETALKNTELELAREKNHVLTIENRLQEEQVQAMLNEERLRMEIEARNKQLSAKALYLAKGNELIDQMTAFLTLLPDSVNSVALKQQIREMKNKIDREDDWKGFIKHLEEANKALINGLKERHPHLTANDIRFLSFIYINMNTREIASLLKITEDACRKRKERMKTKLGIAKNQSLHDYLLLHF